jgi:DNA-binding Lrp family transcriptional regulator
MRPPPDDLALDAADRALINALQGGFPLCDEPFRAVGESLGLSEGEIIERLRALLERRVLTRFGPLYQIEKLGGAFVLAALKVPEDRFEEVAALVNALPEVAHNYRREHAFNMWFVLATETSAGTVFAFPKEREYFVELKLDAG